MAVSYLIWLWAVVVAVAAGCFDWESRRIPNWLTVPSLLLGLVGNTIAFGLQGAKTALAGAGLALAILLPVVWLRALGAGDWKLMGALGAALGPRQIVAVLLATVFLAGIIAVAQISWRKRWSTALSNLVEIVQGFLVFGFQPNPRVNLDNSEMLSLPFGVAAAGATVVCFWALRF